jgi:cystathionine beta-lyase family protein involved in aluminum resistance
VDRRVAANLARVQAAFRRARVGPHHFAGSTGYGHGDLGREALDNVSAIVHTVQGWGIHTLFVEMAVDTGGMLCS